MKNPAETPQPQLSAGNDLLETSQTQSNSASESPQTQSSAVNELPPRRKRFIRRLFQFSLGLILAPPILLILLFALIQIEPVQMQLITWGQSLLQEKGIKLQLVGLQGIIPLDFLLEKLTLADVQGNWLELQGARFSWTLRELFSGQIRIQEIGLRSLFFKRPPHLKKLNPIEDEPKEINFPSHLPTIILEKIDLPLIILAEDLLDEKINFSLQGAMTANSASGIHAHLQLQRLEKKNTALNLTADFDPNQILAINLTATEGGGLIKRITKLPLTGAVDLRLQGRGPIQQWPGELNLRLPGIVELSSSINASLAENQQIHLTGAITPIIGPWLKPKFAPLLGNNISFLIDLQHTNPNIILKQFQLTTQAARLTAQGEINFKDQQIPGLDMALAINNFTQLEPKLSGAVLLKTHIAGELMRPNLNATLIGQKISLDKMHLRQINMQARANFLSSIKRGFPGINLILDGEINDLNSIDKINWQGVLRMPKINFLDITSFKLTSGNFQASLNGTLNPQTKIGDLTLNATIPDLAPWSNFTQRQLHGGITLQSQIAGDPLELNTQIKITTQGLEGLPSFAEKMLGREMQFQAAARIQEQRNVFLENLTFTSKALNCTSQGNIPIGKGALDLRTTLKLPRLDFLTKDVSGNLNAELNMQGEFPNLQTDIRIHGQRINYAHRNLNSLEANFNAISLFDNPHADFSLRLGIPNHALELRANLEQHKTKLEIKNIKLIAPTTAINGGLNLDLDNLTLHGDLRGRVADLGAIYSWTGIPNLQGEADLNLGLINAEKNQKLVFHANGKKLSGNFGRIENLMATGEIADVKNAVGINARIAATELQHGEQYLKSLEINAQGNLKQLNLNAGIVGHDLRLGLDAQLGLTDTAQQIELNNLNGEWRGKTLRLFTPAKFISDAKGIRLSPLRLNFSGTVFNAEGALDARTVSVTMTLDSLPLQLFADLGMIDLTGTGKATLQLKGTPRSPLVQLEIEAHGIQKINHAINSLSPAQITAKGEINNGKFTADLNLNGITEIPAHLQFAIPMHLSLRPFAFNIEQRAPISGMLTGTINLARLNQVFPLDEHALAGEIRTAINLGGTLDVPELGGNLIITNGRYEHTQIGTLIKNIESKIQFAGQKLTIESLSATDGGKGQIQGTGSVILDLIKKDIQIDTRLDLIKTTIMRSDMASAILNGYLTLTGNSQSARAGGKLSVIKSALNIPERITPSIPKLLVREIPARPQKKRSSQSNIEKIYPMNLDIAVEIPSQTFVRGRGLDSEWRGNLTITGLATTPRIIGQLYVQRGIFDFLDRRFLIQEGVLDFHGGYPPIPNVNLKTEATGRNIVAILSLTGAATQPKLTLESQPPFPQDEVLARLLFDRETKEISGFQAIKLAMALRTLTGGGGVPGMDLLGKTRTTLGLDTLDMESTGDSENSLKAGKYLRGNVYLEVESGLATGSSAVRVEKEISRQLSVETSIDHDSSSAFGINWKIDY